VDTELASTDFRANGVYDEGKKAAVKLELKLLNLDLTGGVVVPEPF
jgi:hypothetical protein